MNSEPARNTEFDPMRDHRVRKHGPCELCDRPDKALTFHHLIPRHCHRKPRFRRRFTLEQMRESGLWICKDCHGGIHDLIPNEQDLGWNFHSRELLLAHEAIRRHVEWARKKK